MLLPKGLLGKLSSCKPLSFRVFFGGLKKAGTRNTATTAIRQQGGPTTSRELTAPGIWQGCSDGNFHPWIGIRYTISHSLNGEVVVTRAMGSACSCCCCCSVAKSHPTLCDPIDCNTSGFPVLYCLPEFAQTHVHWVGDAIQLLSSAAPSSYPQSFPASGSAPCWGYTRERQRLPMSRAVWRLRRLSLISTDNFSSLI